MDKKLGNLLVLGAAGFSGSHFLSHIKNGQQGSFDKIILVDNNIEVKDESKFCSIKLDLNNKLEMSKLLDEYTPSYIVNFAGLIGQYVWDEMYNANSGIVFNLLSLLKDKKIIESKVLLIGSAAEYGIPKILPIKETSELNPQTQYGLSKLFQTQIFKFFVDNYGMDIKLARTFNLIGKNISTKLSIGSFIEQIKKLSDKSDLYVGNLHTKRDFLDVEDAASAYMDILLKGKKGEVYNVCKGSSVSMKEIIDYLILKSGKSFNIIVKPEFIRANDVEDIYGDNSKLIKDTGWRAKYSVFDALNRAVG